MGRFAHRHLVNPATAEISQLGRVSALLTIRNSKEVPAFAGITILLDGGFL